MKYLTLFLLALTAFHPIAKARETALPATITDVREFPSIDITQMRLANGMVVLIKPTDFETNEILIKLVALGGYADLTPDKYASGAFASEIARESGLGDMSGDQVSVFLYEHSIDFVSNIHPFSRTVEGLAEKNELAAFFKCVNMLFTAQNFTQAGWQLAQNQAQKTLSHAAKDNEFLYEAAYLKINTADMAALQPLTAKDLENIDFDVAKKFFKQSFSDPSAFVCVVVGNLDIEQTKKLASEHLGSIPANPSLPLHDKHPSINFPKGITEYEMQLAKRPDALARLTFPVEIALNERSVRNMAFACQIIEARLRRVITNQMKLSHGVDVSYEFPCYPFLDHPWISIQFHCAPMLVANLKKLILNELQLMKQKGFLLSEIEEIKKLEAGSNEFWLHDNFYWMTMLANYYLWQWNPIWLEQGFQGISSEDLQTFFAKGLFLDNYTFIIASP